MKYYYKTPFGILYISTAPYGGYNLNLEEDTINWANTPDELAQQVYECASGLEDLDNNTSILKPKDLDEWQVRL
ncbi:MAG: hypothetical protein GY932_11530 [Arcobacter sp.]|nr:hypothetical protein [Arcobacter sp.]